MATHNDLYTRMMAQSYNPYDDPFQRELERMNRLAQGSQKAVAQACADPKPVEPTKPAHLNSKLLLIKKG